MKEKKNISKADKLLELVELNKAKYNLLNVIKENEINNKFDTKENYQMIDLYKYVCSNYNSKLYSLSYDETFELLVLYKELNENSKPNDNIFGMLQLDSKMIILTKTLYDIGGIEFHLFDPEKQYKNTVMEQIMGMIGQKHDEIDNYDEEKVNGYMFYDFSNMFYDKLDEEAKEVSEYDKKIELINLKYNYLYLFNSVEKRALLTSFDMPNYPNVASDIEIETAGLTLDDYLDKFDSSLTSILETHIRNILYLAKKVKIVNLNSLNRVFFKTVASLLADKELLDSLMIDISSYPYNEKISIFSVVEEINTIFKNAKEKEDSIIKYRRYHSI